MQKKYVRPFSILTSLLMVCYLLIPGFASAEVVADQSDNAQDKFSDRLLAEFQEVDSEDKVTFLVKFNKKTNTAAVAERAVKEAKSESLNGEKAKVAKNEAIVSALKTTAEEEQQDVLTYLDDEIEKGNAENIRSYFIVNGLAVTATKKVAEKITDYSEVEKVLPDETRELYEGTASANNMKADDSDVEWNIDRVNAPEAWNMGYDGAGTVVASIDTGVEWDHPALINQYAGYDADSGSLDHTYSWNDVTADGETPYDDVGHGTHTVGTMVGAEDDGSHQVGVAPGAEWIAVKAFTAEGGKDSDLLAAADWVAAPGGDVTKIPDVVNNSWGGGPGKDEWYMEVVDNWIELGIFPEFSAGNITQTNPGGPGSVASPSNYPQSFATGNTDKDDLVADSSLRGPSPYNEIKPDIAAPGTSIVSAYPGGKYETLTGTSMAGPAVSAAAALLRQADPDIDVDTMKEILLDSATPLTDDDYPDTPNNGYGHGLLNAGGALDALVSDYGEITGTVLKEGTDSEEPVISHTPNTFTYIGLDMKLAAEVSDDTSITDVDLLVRKDEDADWETISMDRESGDYKDGVYAGEVPETYIEEPGFQYKMTATDFSGNTSETETVDTTVSFGIDPEDGFQYDFDTGAEGFLYEGDWERGTPTVGPDAQSGEKLAGTHLDGDYSDDTESMLQFPPIDMRDAEDTEVTFTHWFDIEYEYDFGKLLVTNDIDSGDWEEVETFSGRERTWDDYTLDLSDYAGSDNQVYMAFVLESDEKVAHDGWYVDSVQIADPTNETGLFQSSKSMQGIYHTADMSQENGLPIDAMVTVEETGRSVTSSLEDGTYTIPHQSTPKGEDYTIKAESYGYYPEEKSFSLEGNETVEEDFTLEKIPTGDVEMIVTDTSDNEPLDGAKVELVEDDKVAPMTTDTDGKGTFSDVPEGSYTVHVSLADYHFTTEEVEVKGDETVTKDVALDKFPGISIGYDDGEADNARTFIEEGYAYAVKMTPEETATIEGASVYLWGDDWPVPGGNDFSITVYDSDADGNPDERIMDPIDVEGDRGEWNYIDLSDEGLSTDKDYFIVMIQNDPSNEAPGLGIDETSSFADRSYIMDPSGDFEKLDEAYGNLMIRSYVSYSELEAPVLDVSDEDVYTNEETYDVTGSVEEAGELKLYQNEEMTHAEDVKSGAFTVNMELDEGENTFSATLTSEGVESGYSDELLVTKDTEAPKLTVDSPEDGAVVDEDAVTVEGTVEDDHLDEVKVNGEKASLDNNAFSEDVDLEMGENAIVIQATDLAGNETEEEITVTRQSDLEKPVITTPSDGTLTNERDVQLEGEATTGTNVTLYNADSKVADTTVDEDGVFTFDTELKEGKNTFTVEASMDDETKKSDAIEVTLDTKKPELTITEPTDGDVFTEDTAKVSGKAVDEHLDTVTVNDEEVTVEDDTFTKDVPLEKGDNTITVVASDQAGNEREQSLSVTYDPDEAITLKGIQPDKDQYVFPGDTVHVSFSSNVTGGTATYQVEMNGMNGLQDSTSNAMIETLPGLYKGEWTVPSGMDVQDTTITVSIESPEGNTETAETEGKLHIYPDKIERLEGELRYDTAVEVSQKGWSEADTVILAQGEEYADALTGAPLAHQLDAPILLTPGDKLWAATIDEVDRLKASNVIILGGPDAVDESIANTLESNGLNVERIYGKDRFETAEKIAVEIAPDGVDQMAVANGMNFPDALSIASHAAKEGLPILLTKSDWISERTKNVITDLGAEETIAVGGDEVLTDQLLSELPNTTRLSGDDRFGTNIAVNDYFGVDSEHMYVATGMEFADTLTGATLAAKDNSAILLVHKRVPDVVKHYIQDKEVKRLSVYGGDVAVSKEVYDTLRKLLP